MTFEDNLPLSDFYELLDAHFATRQSVMALNTKLEDAGQMFRSIQKRLLIRFKVGVAFQMMVCSAGMLVVGDAGGAMLRCNQYPDITFDHL